jgi:hypothetical protein
MSYDLSADFPRIEQVTNQAPSVFNTRPWRLGLRLPDHIDLWLPAQSQDMNKARAREYVISCGAALFNMRLAIRMVGHDLVVWLLPDPTRADPMHPPALLASVEIVTGRIKKPAIWEQELYEAIERRHTNRSPYKIIPAPLPIITTMEDAAAQEGAYLRLLHRHETRRCMHLAAGVGPNPASFPNNVNHADYGPTPTRGSRSTRRDFWRDERRRFEHNPQLMALSTDDDQPLDWLRAGQGLQRAILTGTRYSDSAPHGLTARYHAPRRYGVPTRRHLLTHNEARNGLSASFLTQRLEEDDLEGRDRRWPWRRQLAELPQMIMRVGYAGEHEEQASTRKTG